MTIELDTGFQHPQGALMPIVLEPGKDATSAYNALKTSVGFVNVAYTK
jgi:hypothetical protein